MNIRKDDMVEVITGDDAEQGPRASQVLRVLPDEEQGRGRRHQPRLSPYEAEPPQSAGRPAVEGNADRRIQRPALLPRVAAAGVRIGKRYAADGRKERFCKKCGGWPGHAQQADAKYAKRRVSTARRRFAFAEVRIAPRRG